MKLGLALRELHRAENDLARDLLQVSSRHSAEHGVFHVARDLAVWSQQHIPLIAEAARELGEDLDPEPYGEPGLADRARRRASELVGRESDAGVLLLHDLRGIYVKASGVSVDWELLAQGAQGARNRELLELAERCHPDTLRQARWANSMLKESATQVLLS